MTKIRSRNRNDFWTLFLYTSKETLHVADYIVADAGHGSEMNYQFIIDELEV
ncbi:hypothetical protein [Companilactobacillus sp. HBUAS56257]|uniref:hypothetical protein n=1 Tax=Companilactobacillus sp. HBUAS56257 TaxID=3109360 RepID=UPI002FF3E635